LSFRATQRAIFWLCRCWLILAASDEPTMRTAKSLRNLAAGLTELGYCVCHNVVAGLLRQMGYSLQSNRKTLEGGSHPDRDAQFR